MPVPSPERIAEQLSLPLTQLREVSVFDALLNYDPVKALLPIPVLALLALVIWWVFRDTWAALDRESAEYRQRRNETSTPDYRPHACLLITAVVLTMQEYYGGRQLFEHAIKPLLKEIDGGGPNGRIALAQFSEYYSYCWWVAARVIGYVVIPLVLWKLLFPRDRILDMGLRAKGFFSHLWIYGLCLAVVVPAMLLIVSQPDFGTYYPFYKKSARSVFDLLAWESIYFVQFFALELFFRGWMLESLRKSLGSSAIFVMAVPYCMIHYGKPYLEAHGAIVAGVVLGSLAMRTRSIYAGFLVHVSVAGLMDLLALWWRDALPRVWWPG